MQFLGSAAVRLHKMRWKERHITRAGGSMTKTMTTLCHEVA